MGICYTAIINKGTEYWCNFCSAQNGPALLGMPYCKQLQLLRVNCETRDKQDKEQQINDQTKQDKSKPNKFNNKDKTQTNNKGKLETDYFVADQDMEIETGSTKATIEMHSEFSDIFTGTGCFKALFHYSLKMMQSSNRCPQDMWHMHLGTIPKRVRKAK